MKRTAQPALFAQGQDLPLFTQPTQARTFFFTVANIDSHENTGLIAQDGTPLYYEFGNGGWNVRKNRHQTGDLDRGTIVHFTDSILDLAAYLNANEIKPAPQK